MEIPGDQDTSEVTSRRTDLGPPAPRSGLRRSLRQPAVAAHRLLDEENIEVEEERERESDVPRGDDDMILGLGESEEKGPPQGRRRGRGPLLL
ncbi:UNVERIFIED_CONTAM: hypothetical protein Slati_3826500 [Sesamum latifolium]|uniref:Uncharacterized protein n=1 Tax=Sesamum latifolium TaxID=2727402 RepID=A0AAW2TK39_9LAMI